MNDDSDENPLDVLAEEFVARFRLGERPALTEFVERHPELAQEIRELFPALVMMEQARSRGETSGRSTSRGVHEHQAAAPERLGEFRILREVGRGGMGIVYEAIQESVGRHVALKVLPTLALPSEIQIQRFQREVRAAAKLQHPRIVPVFGAGEAEGCHFYAMQFVQGMSLDHVTSEVRRLRSSAKPGSRPDGLPSGAVQTLAEGLASGVFPSAAASEPSPDARPLPSGSAHGRSPGGAESSDGDRPFWTAADMGRTYFRSVARIGIQVAEALQYAASQGVLHRDIKPANLLLDLKGNVWITDFGLAKADDSDELTSPGDILGTLRYLAPERLKGEADLRSDVYSLGATLYEMLTLRPLFECIRREQLLAVIAEVDPIRPRLLDAGIPADLETVVLKAIAKDPLDRYASAGDFADDLRRFISDCPVHARRVSTPEKLWRWCRRNPSLSALTLLSVILAGVVLLGSVVSSAIRRERDAAVASREQAERADVEKGVLLRRVALAELESRARAHLAEALSLQQSGQEGQRFGSLREIRHAAELGPAESLRSSLRNAAIAAVQLTDVRPEKAVTVPTVSWSCIDRDLQTTAVLTTGDDQWLRRRRIETGEVLWQTQVTDVGFGHAELRFSGGNRWLLAHLMGRDGAGRLLIVDADSGAIRFQFLITTSLYGLEADIDLTENELVYLADETTVVLFDLQSGRETRRVSLDSPAMDIRLSPQGDRIAICGWKSESIVILNRRTGDEELRLTPDAQVRNQFGLLAWSHDGKLLASSMIDGRVLVWHPESRQLTNVLTGHIDDVIGIEFAPSGYLLLTRSWDKTSKLWNAATGQCLLTSNRQLESIATNLDRVGFRLDRDVGFCDLSFEQGLRRFSDPSLGNMVPVSSRHGIFWGRFSKDETLLATFGQGADIWDVAHGTKLGHLPVGECTDVLFYPDGTQLLTMSECGILRWSLRTTLADGGKTIEVGPPVPVATELGIRPGSATWLADDRSFAVVDQPQERIVILGDREESPRFLPEVSGALTTLAASPDGKWLGAGVHRSGMIQVWDLETGRKHEFAAGTGVYDLSLSVCFSSDSRWLICGTHADAPALGYSVFAVGTWNRTCFVPAQSFVSRPISSPDGQLFAGVQGPYRFRISEANSGQEVAELRLPDSVVNTPLAFLGSRAEFASIETGQNVVLWNLDVIGKTLRAAGLEWDARLSRDRAESSAHLPLRLVIHAGNLAETLASARVRRSSREILDRVAEAARTGAPAPLDELLDQALKLAPESPEVLNQAAWTWGSPAETRRERLSRADELSAEAVRLSPANPQYLNTRGVILYRLGRSAEAISVLEDAEVLLQGRSSPFNTYFLAMASWQQGQKEAARRWLGQAQRRHDEEFSMNRELEQFRREAEALITAP